MKQPNVPSTQPDPTSSHDHAASLQRERERVAALIASVPGVVWEAWGQPDVANQRIDFVSDFVTSMLGYSIEEWLATPNFWLEIVHPDDRERAAAEAYAIFSSRGKLGASRFRWVGKDGRACWVEARSTTICDDAGNPVGMRGVTFDISKQVEAERRHAKLADASAALASSLDLEQTLRTVTRVLVPGLADLCVIHLLQPDGSLALVEFSHADPQTDAAVKALLPAPVDALAYDAFQLVLAGEAVLRTDVSDEELRPGAPDELHFAVLRALGVRDVMVVPLVSRGGPLGALTLATCGVARRYAQDDVTFAVELGRRCGAAVENAALFVAARTELEQRRRAEARLERKARQQELLAELGRIALGHSTAEAVARHATRSVRDACDVEAVYVLDVRPTGLGVVASSGGDGTSDDEVRALATRVVAAGAAEHAGALSAVPIAVPPRRFGALVASGGAWDDDERRFLELVANVLASATERERSEAALQQEKERLAVTLRSIGEGVIATDVGARVVLVNTVAEHLTGWAQADAIGRPITDICPILSPRTRLPVENPILGALRAGRVGSPDLQTAVLAREGNERVLAQSAAPIRDRLGNTVGAVLVCRDITDKERIDAELQRANTLDSLGVLAGGIAHDFNNILTTVLANLSLAHRLLPATHPASGRLAQAERASTRARDLTQQLLTFARGGAPVRTPTSLADIVRESAGFVLSGSSLRARFGIDPDPWVVEVDAGQISQVVQNLVLNAIQAMPGGGTVDVDVRNVRLDDPTGMPIPAGTYVRVDVADRGPGVDQANLRRIFDPFFTTRPNGTGLGLATAYTIVKKHDGHIHVASEPGNGARFSVFLPTARAQEVVQRPPAPAPLARGAGRVLVMDDDPDVGSTLVDLLDALGFTAALTTDGAEAIGAYEVASRSGASFVCAILDLTVPGGMGGLPTLRALRAFDPDVRAIVSSGYSEDPVMSDHRRHGFADVLRKPYTMMELAQVLARVTGNVTEPA